MRLRKRLIIDMDGEDEGVQDLIDDIREGCGFQQTMAERDGLNLVITIREENMSSTPTVNINMAPIATDMHNLSRAISSVRETVERIRRKNAKEDTPRDIEDVLYEVEREELRSSPRKVRFRKKGEENDRRGDRKENRKV